MHSMILVVQWCIEMYAACANITVPCVVYMANLIMIVIFNFLYKVYVACTGVYLKFVPHLAQAFTDTCTVGLEYRD